jgi:hypothetical protein
MQRRWDLGKVTGNGHDNRQRIGCVVESDGVQ